MPYQYDAPEGKDSEKGFWQKLFYRITGYKKQMPVDDEQNEVKTSTENKIVNLSFDEVHSLMVAALLSDENLDEIPSVLYLFQYLVLPNAAFNNDPRLFGELAGVEELPGCPLIHFIFEANYEHQKYTGSEEISEMNLNFIIHPPVEQEDFTIHTIEFMQVKVMESHFIGIAKNDKTNDTKYFSLEKTDDDVIPNLFCELLPSGNRKNYGYGLDSVPNLDGFLKLILDQTY